MHPDFKRLMQAATRLTRSGNLQAATAAIRAALVGRSAPPAANAPHMHQPDAGGEAVIDVEARELPAETAARAPQPQAPVTAREASPEAPQAAPQARRAAAPAPQGEGQFIAGRWNTGSGGRDYKLYIPPQAAAGQPLPLVVMLHGCTQDPDDFAAGTRMNEAGRAQGCFVLYPAQAQHANAHRCWNWFKHSHQARDRGEPALLAGMTRDVMAHHPVDPARVYVAGLSAGGAMAAIMGDAYPELYAAVGVHSGLATGSAKDLPSALSAMKRANGTITTGTAGPPTIVFHGDADRTVHPGNGEQVINASAPAAEAAPAAPQRASGGREYTRRVHRAGDGRVMAEHWLVHGSPHAWSGGSTQGTYTDPQGPDATAEMLRFFLEHPRAH